MAIPWAALAVTGAGLAGGLFGKKSQQGGLSRGDIEGLIANRNNDITNFANSLAQARTKYMASLSNLNTMAFNKYGGQAEANYAARGLQVTGGAFQSALAKKAAELQAQGDLTAAEMERGDLGKVEGLRSDAFAAGFGAQREVKAPTDPYSGLYGQLFSAGLSSALDPRSGGDNYDWGAADDAGSGQQPNFANSIARYRGRAKSLNFGGSQSLYQV